MRAGRRSTLSLDRDHRLAYILGEILPEPAPQPRRDVQSRTGPSKPLGPGALVSASSSDTTEFDCWVAAGLAGGVIEMTRRLTRRLRDVKPYRWGMVVCVSCGEGRECIAYGSRHARRSVPEPPKDENQS